MSTEHKGSLHVHALGVPDLSVQVCESDQHPTERLLDLPPDNGQILGDKGLVIVLVEC